MPITTCVFDAYGTLFDVASAARELAARPGNAAFRPHADALAKIWRDKQLEYSWLRAITGTHADFWKVTQDGLDYALEAAGLADDAALREELLALYWELQAYPEVHAVLERLKKAGKNVAILSNGSPAMLTGAVDRAGLGDLLDSVISVEEVGVFKPHPAVYELVGRTFDCSKKHVLFVSSNGWDAGCAAGFGFETVWVNRNGAPMDRLPWTPQTTLSDLTPIPELADTL